MERVKKNDTVKVISGKDAGKEGRVVRVYPDREKVFVEGVNIATKHRRVGYSRQGAQEGGIVHEEVPVHLSNVMPICPSCDVPTRVGAKVVDDKKVRYCRKCDSEF
jgi:large subunit ribosomal protein L24